jgi:hypothetical protein
MPASLLLVHDDLATIASVRKALTRAGHTVHLATSTADALTAFEHLAPEAVLLAPAVEAGQGARFLTELRSRPAGAVMPVLLLGEAVPGLSLPVLALPVNAADLVNAVESALSPTEADDLPLLDAGHMEELPPLMNAALAQAEADLEAEVLADLHTLPELPGEPSGEPGARASAAEEARTHAAREDAEHAHARADAAESARADAEAARARAEQALRAYQRAETEERTRRTEEARRLEAEARAAQAQVEEAQARAEAAQEAARAAEAQGTAEAELLADALREEVERRTRELAAQQSLRAEAEARAEREARARAEADARAKAEAARLAAEVRRSEETAERAREDAEARAEREARARAEAEARAKAETARLAAEVRRSEEAAVRAREEAEARAAEQVTRLATEVREREEAARQARAEADDWAARERKALAQADRARGQAQALEVEAAQLAERLAQGERAALEALARAEEALRRERAAGEALRGELAAARASSGPPGDAIPSDFSLRVPRATARTAGPVAEAVPARRQEPRPPDPAPLPGPGLGGIGAAARLEWGAADGGRVTLDQLAALMLRLSEVRATARIELRAEDTLRILWLSEGELVGAASTHPAESLVQRAVSDGLLDVAMAAEARTLRLPDEALAAELVERGALREAEVVPLLQRCTEARALEALSERDTAYRLAADATPPSDGCAPTRALVAVLAEALRRALPPEEVEARTKGVQATPRTLRRVDLGRFEFGERERRLLEAVDGERTVLELLTRTGIRQDAGLRTLAVAEVLGLVDVAAPAAAPHPEVPPEVELERLEAKWAASEEADYFSVLGVPRSAGTEEVQRAHARLAAEFDPLRYAGHPDPDVSARAARLQTLLDEAARALTDERLRIAYARSLVDGEGTSRAT